MLYTIAKITFLQLHYNQNVTYSDVSWNWLYFTSCMRFVILFLYWRVPYQTGHKPYGSNERKINWNWNSSSDHWGSPYNCAQIWTSPVNVYSWKLKVVKVGVILYWNEHGRHFINDIYIYLLCLCNIRYLGPRTSIPPTLPPPNTHTHTVTKIKTIWNTLYSQSISLSCKSCKSCQKWWMILVLDRVMWHWVIQLSSCKQSLSPCTYHLL